MLELRKGDGQARYPSVSCVGCAHLQKQSLETWSAQSSKHGCTAELDRRGRILFLSAPTPMLGGAKENVCCIPFPYCCCGNKVRVSVLALMTRACSGGGCDC